MSARQFSKPTESHLRATGTPPTVAVEECAGCGELREVALHDAHGQPVCDGCRCECCGGVPTECPCEIGVEDGYDPETGPYSDRGCATHKCSV